MQVTKQQDRVATPLKPAPAADAKLGKAASGRRHFLFPKAVAALLALAPAGWGAPSLSVGQAAGDAGATVAVPVSFDPGGSSVAAIQFSLHLPSELKAGVATLGPVASAADKSISVNLQGGQWTFIIFGLNQTSIGKGLLATVNVQIVPGAAAQTIAIPLSGMVYADPAGTPVTAGAGQNGSVLVQSGGLPVPDVSGIHEHVFTLKDEIRLSYPRKVQRFLWTLVPAGETIPRAGLAAGSGPGTPVATPTSSLSLAAQRLAPGNYTLRVSAQDGDLSSPEAAARMTIVSADLSGVNVFPNPWKQERHAGQDIVFDNLTLGSTVKLFAVNGHLVRELKPIGSQAVWNRKNDKDDLVASGIYLYLVTDAHGNKRKGKLALVR